MRPERRAEGIPGDPLPAGDRIASTPMRGERVIPVRAPEDEVCQHHVPMDTQSCTMPKQHTHTHAHPTLTVDLIAVCLERAEVSDLE